MRDPLLYYSPKESRAPLTKTMSALWLGTPVTALAAAWLFFVRYFNEVRHEHPQSTSLSIFDSRPKRAPDYSLQIQSWLRCTAPPSCVKWCWESAVRLPGWPNQTENDLLMNGEQFENKPSASNQRSAFQRNTQLHEAQRSTGQTQRTRTRSCTAHRVDHRATDMHASSVTACSFQLSFETIRAPPSSFPAAPRRIWLQQRCSSLKRSQPECLPSQSLTPTAHVPAFLLRTSSPSKLTNELPLTPRVKLCPASFRTMLLHGCNALKRRHTCLFVASAIDMRAHACARTAP